MQINRALKQVSWIIIVIISNYCKQRDETVLQEKTLLEVPDKAGRIRQRVVTGRLPGEDMFLTITKFDSSGMVIEEYGAKPYGVKFKTTYQFDQFGNLREKVVYQFAGGQNFENYDASKDLYSIEDTTANYQSVKSKIRTRFDYDTSKGIVHESRYQVAFDSLGKEKVKFLDDTTYLNKKP
jgi:hypothetical protein